MKMLPSFSPIARLMFGFDGVKEIMPYGLWNTKTIKDKFMLLSDTREYCDRQLISMNIGKDVTDEEKLHDYKPIRFIAHNVKYDFQFLYEHLYQVSKIQRGSMLLSARADFYVCTHG